MSHVLVLISNPARPALDQPLVDDLLEALPPAGPGRWLADSVAWEVALKDGKIDKNSILAAARTQLGDCPVDIALVPSANRRKKLLVADMDSTMIEQECIDEVADTLGVREKVAAITERAMRGDTGFEDALRARVSLLKGVTNQTIRDIIETRLTLTSGGKTLVATMAANSAFCALVSGGFTLFTAAIAEKLGFHENRANRLEFENDRLTGRVTEPILGSAAKKDALNELAGNLGGPDNALAVGDGANDLEMIRAAGLGVAFRAKPVVAREAAASISHGDLTALLYLQGYEVDEFIV